MPIMNGLALSSIAYSATSILLPFMAIWFKTVSKTVK